MRLWTIHPRYLDARGLVALWREALLAKKVLEGKTRGYTNHPQLERFRKAERPIDAINQYLAVIYEEALKRGYRFDRSKIDMNFTPQKISVKRGQIGFEIGHLLKKLKKRDRLKYDDIMEDVFYEAHPLFKLVKGEVEDWEKTGS
ncbi:MAG TPA: pyrimidine dimer DNA glycosylase/endonuclease V [Bacteroidales bacterium]|nr:pyrimidine dimer DNA glycosylase/endonuclease V [Bacteroidales bacterium]